MDDTDLRATTNALTPEELEKLIAEGVRQELEKWEAKKREKWEAEASLLEQGTFFSPWSKVWIKETVDKDSCKGAFKKLCRKKGFADNIQQYKDVLERTESQAEMKIDASNEPDHSKNQYKGKERNKVEKYVSPRRQSSGSTISSQNSARRSNSGISNASSAASKSNGSSASSQSRRFPDFGGKKPSTRAHMIPDPKTTSCFKYYIVIIRAVLGLSSDDDLTRLEKTAKELAASEYNFLRAPHLHGDFFDNKPCWIFVPACSLEDIRTWKPSDVYPVLAVANSAHGTEVEEAYQMMCILPYNDKTFDPSKVKDGVLKRSKCKEQEFDQATQNLRQMTLAMAETLVGEGFKIRPDQSLHENKKSKRGKKELSFDDRNYIMRKLRSKTEKNEVGEESGEVTGDESGKEESRKSRAHLHPTDFDRVLFEVTSKSLRSGIMLPKRKQDLNFESCELLQFEVDPSRNLDLYPDPMLLLIKAAINWSWHCNQKLLPACGRANEDEEEEELDVPSTPIPTVIEFKPVPVTPDDDVSVMLREEELDFPTTPIPTVIDFKPVPVTPDDDVSVKLRE